MRYIIRTAKMSDLEAVTEVERACFPPAEAASKESFEQRMNAFLNNFFVAETEGKIIGVIDGSTTDERTITDEMFDDTSLHVPEGAYQAVFGLLVHPDYQSCGVASALMKHFIQDAKERGKKGVILTCKDRLISYYERFGYKNLGVSASVHGGAVWYDMILEF